MCCVVKDCMYQANKIQSSLALPDAKRISMVMGAVRAVPKALW